MRRIILVLIMFIVSVSLSNAKYYVLNDANQVIGRCDNLKIETDNDNRFSRAVFSECVDSQVFSYSRDFHYIDTKS